MVFHLKNLGPLEDRYSCDWNSQHIRGVYHVCISMIPLAKNVLI